MECNNKEYNVDELVKNVNTEFHRNYNGIILTDYQVNILSQYGFDINKYQNSKELIFDIDDYLNDNADIVELEQILDELSEEHYYNNVNK